MSTASWNTITEIVAAALRLESAAREKYLDEACPDAEMRAEVESLLAHETPGFLERPAAARFAPTDGVFSPVEATADLNGQLVSHYRIEQKLGRGGMGDVYLAQDQELDRLVALKLLAGWLEGDAAATQRFMREARSAAALDHPYICKIYEIGEAAAKPFIAMEYVVGETLADHIGEQPLPLLEALSIATEIAEALYAAHAAHIVHRDLKPSNIMMTPGGHVKVLDFGLAKRVASGDGRRGQFETASRHTGAGMTMGTLAYMAPEQLRGQTVDARADIFAFGIVLFELLTGKHPFDRDTAMDCAAAILNDTAPPPSRLRSDVPKLLDDIVGKMLAKDVDERCGSVVEVRSALVHTALAEKAEERLSAAIAPAGSSAASSSRIPLPRSRLGRFAAAVAISALVAGGLWALRSDVPELSAGSISLPSVAIVPLSNLGDSSDDYLAEGIGLAVRGRLARIGFRCASWATASAYGEDSRPADVLAGEIGVQALISGGFRIDDDNEITTTMTLTRADGKQPLFKEPIVGRYHELFDLQSRIAIAVATVLKGGLTAAEERTLSAPESSDVGAYDLYLRGVHSMKQGTVESRGLARDYFVRATSKDGALADAPAGEGTVRQFVNIYGGPAIEP